MSNGNIIINFRPFVLKQQVLVYQNGECVKELHFLPNEIVDAVASLCKEYETPRVSLCGSKMYVSRYAERLNTKFNEMNLDIDMYTH